VDERYLPSFFRISDKGFGSSNKCISSCQRRWLDTLQMTFDAGETMKQGVICRSVRLPPLVGKAKPSLVQMVVIEAGGTVMFRSGRRLIDQNDGDASDPSPGGESYFQRSYPPKIKDSIPAAPNRILHDSLQSSLPHKAQRSLLSLRSKHSYDVKSLIIRWPRDVRSR
jgi:hypothetical protein